MAEQLAARFPGVVSALGGTLSVTAGDAPGVCTLRIIPQASPPAMFGTLEIFWGGRRIEIPDCRVVSASYQRDSGGRIVSLQIEDWRWRWRFGSISGRYNRRDADGVIIPHTERTPSELFELCFAAAGHANYSLSGLPDTARPEVDWEEPQTPMVVAARLAEELGCEIVPGDNMLASVLPIGVGADLPSGPDSYRMDVSDVLDPPEKPDSLAVIGAPVDFQCDLEVEAVTREVAGEFVLPDDASYKPAAGWLGAAESFEGITDLKARTIAGQYLYRTFRVVIPNDGLEIPGYTDITGKKVKRLDQLVILDRQAEKEEQYGKAVYRPAWLYGAFDSPAANQLGDNALSNTRTEPEPITDPESDLAKETIWRGGVSVNSELGIVFTSDRATLTTAAGASGPAKFRLRVAVNVRDDETDELTRYVRQRQYGTKTGTKPGILRHNEIVARTVPTYAADYRVVSVETTNAEADAEADYYLDAQERAWRDDRPSEATYAGLLPTALDGALSHIVYTFGSDIKPTTRIARNTKFKEYVAPFKGLKINAKVKAAIAKGVV